MIIGALEPFRVVGGPWGHFVESITLKSTLQNAALRKAEVRRVLEMLSEVRGGGVGTDSGAGVNVNEEGECPARIANHKRQQASWAWAKDFMTFAY